MAVDASGPVSPNALLCDAFLLRLSDALRPLTDADDITGAAARMLGEQIRAASVFHFTVEGEERLGEVVHVISRDYDRDPNMPIVVGRYRHTADGGNPYRTLSHGESWWCAIRAS